MNNTFFNNLINFPDVDFELVLFYILHLTSVANRITGWYLGVGEGRVYATGVPSADKNFAFKISMPYKLFTSTSTLVSGVVPSFSSMKLLTTRPLRGLALTRQARQSHFGTNCFSQNHFFWKKMDITLLPGIPL